MSDDSCVGVCTETSDMVGVVAVILSGLALVAGLLGSWLNSWTNYLAKAFEQRDSVTKEQTYPPGRDAFFLISSLQFVATILATDRGQIPESLRAYGNKFQWANFQVKFENASLRKTCDVDVRDQLFGTALTCSIVFFGSFLIRESLHFLITRWAKGMTGIRNSPGFLATGHWELVWFLVMSLGWSVSAGKAVGSECIGWQIIGVTILVFLPVMGLCIIHVSTRFAIEYDPVVIFERSKDHPVVSSIVDLSQLYLPYHGCAGRWKMLPGTSSPAFLQIFSKYIEIYRQDLWYYGSVVLVKKICTGLIYGVTKASTAALLLCIVNVVEALTLALTQPHVEFKLYLRGVLQSTSMMVVSALLVAHANDACSDAALTLTAELVTAVLLVVALIDQFFTASEELVAALDNAALLKQPKEMDLHERLVRVRSSDEDARPSSPHGGIGVSRTVVADLILQNVQDNLRLRNDDVEPLAFGRVGNAEHLRRISTQSLAISMMPTSPGPPSLAQRLMEAEVGVGPSPVAFGDTGSRQLYGIRDRLVQMGHWYNPRDSQAPLPPESPTAQEPRSSTMRIRSPWEPAAPRGGAGVGSVTPRGVLPAGLKLGEMEEIHVAVPAEGGGAERGGSEEAGGEKGSALRVVGPPFAMPWSARVHGGGGREAEVQERREGADGGLSATVREVSRSVAASRERMGALQEQVQKAAAPADDDYAADPRGAGTRLRGPRRAGK